MKSINAIYEFIVSIQLISLIIFLFDLFESGFDKVIYISLGFSKSINFGFEFHFNYWTIIGIVSALGVFLIVTSIQGLGSGLDSEGILTIKQLTTFIAKFAILEAPLGYIIGKSEFLDSFSGYIALFVLIIYIFHFLNTIEKEGSSE